MPPWPSTRVRRLALALLAALAASLVLTAGAFAGAITPESGGSPNANDIASLYRLAGYIAIFVFLAVEIALVYSLFRFAHRRGRIAAQIRGNTNLEIGWTVAAALILVVLTIVTFSKLSAIKTPVTSGPGGLAAAAAASPPTGRAAAPPGQRLHIDVNGQQYVWRYTYPNGAFAYDEMVVPINTTVMLAIRAQDVIHSWWIPELGGKFDAVPGPYVNRTWFKISRPGVYRGQCAELCGRNHANMVAHVKAVPVAEYQRWVQRQKQAIDAANRAVAAQRQPSASTPAGGG
ncbi:MAG: cytochrome c oxidase subunit II [Solirubrobacteraceae bacterium]